jgi:multidrug efflux pump
VETALRNENVELPAGRIESTDRDTLRVERNYIKPEDFATIPLGKGRDGYVVRMGDVAKIELASAERRAYYRSNGEPGIGLGIVKTSTANSLDVARTARAEAERVALTLPKGTQIFVAFDNTTFIEAAVDRVYATLVEAMILVLVVIWLFLGSFRAALIPAVTVPVCLVAAFIALYAFDFSINLLTLLALVLCIGLVVDDAIVVVENVQRRIDLGEPPLVASKRGTAQVAFAVIATTAVLVAVFLPVGFLEGNTGRLFRELAVALAAAVALSAFVALTLTPMMASKLLKPHTGQAPRPARLHQPQPGALGRCLWAVLDHHVDRTWIYLLVMVAALVASWGLLKLLPSELAPAEDRGSFQIMIDGPEGAGYDYTCSRCSGWKRCWPACRPGQADRACQPARARWLRCQRGNAHRPRQHLPAAVAPAQRRPRRTWPTNCRRNWTPSVACVCVRRSVAAWCAAAGSRSRSCWVGRNTRRSRSGATASCCAWPTTPAWSARLGLQGNPAADAGQHRPPACGRSRRAVTAIGSALETMMGSRRVTTFVDNGEEYDVLVRAGRDGRASPADLAAIRVRATSGELVPLSNLVTLSEVAEAGTLNRFNRLRSITISAGLAPGYPLGEAIAWAQNVAQEELPQYAQVNWKGESREYQSAGGAVLLTFAMALLVVYLVLAAQFELHPPAHHHADRAAGRARRWSGCG